MRVGDILYFSPKFRFRDLDWANSTQLLEAFYDRVIGYYISPAEKLCKDSFACGVLCVTTIDFIARIQSGNANTGNRIVNWLISEIPEFSEKCPHCGISFAELFYSNFRNGLVHEGRIKKLGQFSYDDDKKMIVVENEIMRVNPALLLGKLKKAFYKYLKMLEADENALTRFVENLKDDFGEEVYRAKSI